MYKKFTLMLVCFSLICLAACNNTKNPAMFTNVEIVAPSIAGDLPEQINDSLIPFSFEQQLEVGKLRYTVNDVRIMTDISEYNIENFDPYCALAMHNGEYYQKAQDNWKEYGRLYEIIYSYPTFAAENGSLINGAFFVLLDITVDNIDATNEYTNKNGHLEARYNNPYYFKMDSILYLIDRSQLAIDAIGSSVCYFNRLGNYPEHPMIYEVKPGEQTSLQIGFLVGDRMDGSPTHLSDLVISTDSTSLDGLWFELGLEDCHEKND